MKDNDSAHGGTARIGMVNYINTAPIYEVWKRTVNNPRYDVVEAPPAVLNRMLAADAIDLGFVSSYEYCRRPERYRILDDLSISSTGPVGSVFLFSHTPLEQLDGKLVLLSSQSETSVCLTKVILEEFLRIRPQYLVGDVRGEISHSCQAVLAIGDEALRLVSSGLYAYQFDLGEMWNRHTGLPFVFSVCVVRKQFCHEHGALVEAIRSTMVACRQQGREELEAISRRVAELIPMEHGACYSYLQALEYDLGPSKRQALAEFFRFLIGRGEASPLAIPLQIFPEV